MENSLFRVSSSFHRGSEHCASVNPPSVERFALFSNQLEARVPFPVSVPQGVDKCHPGLHGTRVLNAHAVSLVDPCGKGRPIPHVAGLLLHLPDEAVGKEAVLAYGIPTEEC